MKGSTPAAKGEVGHADAPDAKEEGLVGRLCSGSAGLRCEACHGLAVLLFEPEICEENPDVADIVLAQVLPLEPLAHRHAYALSVLADDVAKLALAVA